MKKYFLVVVIAAICCVTAKSQQYAYCALVKEDIESEILVDHGVIGIFEEKQKGIFSDSRKILKTKEGRNVTNLIDAMNFMSADGWEFVERYIIPTYISPSVERDVHYWLLKKPVDLLTPEQKEAYNKRYGK